MIIQEDLPHCLAADHDQARIDDERRLPDHSDSPRGVRPGSILSPDPMGIDRDGIPESPRVVARTHAGRMMHHLLRRVILAAVTFLLQQGQEFGRNLDQDSPDTIDLYRHSMR